MDIAQDVVAPGNGNRHLSREAIRRLLSRPFNPCQGSNLMVQIQEGAFIFMCAVP